MVSPHRYFPKTEAGRGPKPRLARLRVDREVQPGGCVVLRLFGGWRQRTEYCARHEGGAPPTTADQTPCVMPGTFEDAGPSAGVLQVNLVAPVVIPVNDDVVDVLEAPDWQLEEVRALRACEARGSADGRIMPSPQSDS